MVEPISPQVAEIFRLPPTSPVSSVADIFEYQTAQGKILGVQAKFPIEAERVVIQTFKVLKESILETTRFLGTLFFGDGGTYYITPSADASLKTLILLGEATIGGELTVEGVIYADGGINTSSGDLLLTSASGLTSLTGDLSVAGNTVIEGDLTVSGGDIVGANSAAIDIGEDGSGDIHFYADGDTDDYIYLSTATDIVSILWEGVLAYANDPGIRVNATTGEFEYRDEDESTWTPLDDLKDGGDAGTLDTLDSLQFLRSDASDNYTSGTLTFDAATTLSIDSGAVLDILGTWQMGGTAVTSTAAELNLLLGETDVGLSILTDANIPDNLTIDATGNINAAALTSGTVPSARVTGAYAGITGVGTLTAGTWNADTVTVPYGGTGATSLTGMLKGNGAGAFTAVTGTASYATYWLDNNTIAAEQYLNVSRGGTGAGTFIQYGVLYGNAASALQVTAAGSTGQALIATTGAAPSWGTVGTAHVTDNSLDFIDFEPTLDLDRDSASSLSRARLRTPAHVGSQ